MPDAREMSKFKIMLCYVQKQNVWAKCDGSEVGAKIGKNQLVSVRFVMIDKRNQAYFLLAINTDVALLWPWETSQALIF